MNRPALLVPAPWLARAATAHAETAAGGASIDEFWIRGLHANLSVEW